MKKEKHVGFICDSKLCLAVSVRLHGCFWWTGDLFWVYSASCLLTGLKRLQPPPVDPQGRYRKWMDRLLCHDYSTSCYFSKFGLAHEQISVWFELTLLASFCSIIFRDRNYAFGRILQHCGFRKRDEIIFSKTLTAHVRTHYCFFGSKVMKLLVNPNDYDWGSTQ